VIRAIAPSLREDCFGIDPEITAKLARKKFRIAERPIECAGRSYAEGKEIGLLDAARVAYCVVRYWWKD